MPPVEITLNEGLFVLRPSGGEDLTVQVSRDDLSGFLTRNTDRLPMLVDLADLRILQSSGVGLLFFLLIEAEKASIPVGFINASELVAKILSIAGVSDLAKIYPD